MTNFCGRWVRGRPRCTSTCGIWKQQGSRARHACSAPNATGKCWNGVPVAFIDWDAAQPVDPLTDLANAAWTFVPLAPPSQLAGAGFDPLPDLPARLRAFLDAYGLPDRKTILPALEQSVSDEPERLRWLQHVSPDLARAL